MGLLHVDREMETKTLSPASGFPVDFRGEQRNGARLAKEMAM